MSISSKIGCAPQTLNEWVKRAEVDRGERTGVTTEMAEKMQRGMPQADGRIAVEPVMDVAHVAATERALPRRRLVECRRERELIRRR